MHLHAIVGKHAGHFAADDDVGPIRKRERAADFIVVGDDNEVHAARLGDAIHVFGRVVALAHDTAGADRSTSNPSGMCERGCRVSRRLPLGQMAVDHRQAKGCAYGVAAA